MLKGRIPPNPYRRYRKGAEGYRDTGRIDPQTGDTIWAQNNSITYLGTTITGFFQQKTWDSAEYKRELTAREWKSFDPIVEDVRKAIANPDCANWLTSDIKIKFNPLKELNTLISTKHFFKGGKPGTYATTYSPGGAPSLAWIGLRELFFQQSRWEQVNTVLHELRHALHLGTLAHPESFKTDAEKVRWIQNGNAIETPEGFNRGVYKNCINPLRRATR